VRILGSVDRDSLASILLTTNVFVFPTSYEGFGLALLEAMASGHACLSYDIPAAREVLGDCGLYVPAGNASGLVEAIAELVRNPRRIAGFAARAHDRAGAFSWEDAGASIDRIIRDTVRKRRSCPAIPAPDTPGDHT
jgi:glycosyltransferase involved in cell wall biosynthesis